MMWMKQSFTIVTVFAAFLVISCASDKKPAWLSVAERGPHKWGYYSGYVEARWENDGRNMILLRDLAYLDPQGVTWTAPAGSEVDGASIPRSLWSIMGGPFEGKYRNASVLHDVAYEQQKRPWEDCDRMFYNAMRCSGVSAAEAGTMYYALYKFGRHWKTMRRAKPVKIGGKMVARGEEIPRAIPVNSDQVNEARDWIRSSDPSLEQIEERAYTEGH